MKKGMNEKRREKEIDKINQEKNVDYDLLY